ncbi:PucR family transcriptional regulator [Paenibacillus sp.]|uniref:PucR family transcriptional regulator n=1 Tax=Paenibacillus sp. TaxID=58172 RepID=UPI002D63A9A3|nr:PucR family transcriptional regulator ligand-binding domain-containing protein [Paenibacillus sp.]HZG87447.1 PucR family transcriptional regulator ligand-binding domain-containing protein [Paenibacillus sp.]
MLYTLTRTVFPRMLLSELLQKPFFAPSTILAGHSGIHRPVQYVNIMDVPDMIRYLKKDELLLTNAYVLKDDPDLLVMLVRDMHEKGCAGLMINSRRFMPKKPEKVLSEANRLQFPVIEPPLGITLGEISNQIVGFILEKKTEEMKYTLESHQYFSDLILQGKSLPEIVDALAVVLHRPVILFNHIREPIAVSADFRSPPYGEVVTQLQNALHALAFTSPPTRLSLPSPQELHPEGATAYPIQSYQSGGFLVVFGQTEPEKNLSHLAVEQAVNVIRFEMLKMQAVKERSRRYKNEFFADVVEGRVTSEQELLYRGGRYGLAEGKMYLCVVAKLDPPHRPKRLPPDQDTSYTHVEQLYEIIKQELQKKELMSIRFVKNDAIVLFVSDNDASLEEQLKHIGETVFERHQIALSFGVGKPVDQLTDIPLTYSEAMEALEFGYSCNKGRFVQSYNKRELIDLFRLIRMKDLHAYYRDTLQPFAHLEEKERGDLLQTLKAYYSQNCHIGNTAARLYVHRNTVIYRLEKCAQLLGRDLHAADEILRFRIAFLIEPLLQP